MEKSKKCNMSYHLLYLTIAALFRLKINEINPTAGYPELFLVSEIFLHEKTPIHCQFRGLKKKPRNRLWKILLKNSNEKILSSTFIGQVVKSMKKDFCQRIIRANQRKLENLGGVQYDNVPRQKRKSINIVTTDIEISTGIMWEKKMRWNLLKNLAAVTLFTE